MTSVVTKGLAVASLLLLIPWLAPQAPRAQQADPGEQAAEAVRRVAAGLAQNRPVVLWDALAPTQQRGLSKLLQRCAAKLDATAWRHGFQTIERMGLVLTRKPELVEGSRLAMSLLSVSSEDRSAEPWFRIGPLLTELGRSPVSDPVQLGKLDVQGFLSREGRAVSAKLPDISSATRGSQADLVALQDQLANMTATPLKVDASRALVRLESPGLEPREEWFVRSEGKWMPESIVTDWQSHMANADARCAQLAQGGSAARWIKTLGDARGGFDELARAEDQPQFDAGMSSVANAVGPELAQMALDSMLGGSSIGGIQLNVGNIIYNASPPEAAAPSAEEPAEPAPGPR